MFRLVIIVLYVRHNSYSCCKDKLSHTCSCSIHFLLPRFPLAQLYTFELCGATLYDLRSSPGITVVAPKCLRYRVGKGAHRASKGFYT